MKQSNAKDPENEQIKGEMQVSLTPREHCNTAHNSTRLPHSSRRVVNAFMNMVKEKVLFDYCCYFLASPSTQSQSLSHSTQEMLEVCTVCLVFGDRELRIDTRVWHRKKMLYNCASHPPPYDLFLF